MKITVSNKLYIEGASPTVIRTLKKGLEIPNPAFQVMLRKFGRRVYHMKAIKQKYCYYEHDEVNDIFICGRGNLMRIHRYLRNNGIKHELVRDFVSSYLREPIFFNGELRDYQGGVTNEIIGNGSYGVIRLDTAWGKTVLACDLIPKLKKKTLIIVPRKMILDQFIESIKQFLNYDAGIIQGKIFNIKDITVASSDTLRNRDLSEIKNNWGLVLVDECHQFITEKRTQVVQSFNPKYLYGLTGTLDRDDGQKDAIGYLFGPKLIDGKLRQIKPTVFRVKTNVVITGVDYAEMVSDMIENESRNNLIKKIIEKEINENRKVLVLTKRKKHNEILNSILGKNILVISLDSNTKKKEELLMQARDTDDFDVILGTYSLLGTGINIESLSSIVLAGDLKSRLLTTQSAGRGLRKLLNKPDVHIWDLVDNLHGIFKRQAYNRGGVYREKGWEVIDKII